MVLHVIDNKASIRLDTLSAISTDDQTKPRANIYEHELLTHTLRTRVLGAAVKTKYSSNGKYK